MRISRTQAPDAGRCPTELHVYADGFHGFDGFAAESEAAQRFTAEYTRLLPVRFTVTMDVAWGEGGGGGGWVWGGWFVVRTMIGVMRGVVYCCRLWLVDG